MLGVIKDLDIEKYHSVEGISRSGIMEFRKSPAHYWNAYLNPDRPPKEPTEAMIFGNAFHTFILEPEEFENRYCVKPEQYLLKDFIADNGKEIGREMYEQQKADLADFMSKSASKTILKPEQVETLHLMRQSLEKHPQAKSLITGGDIERSIFWRDPHTDVLCKTRPDIWHSNMTVDLKTISSADERTFTNAMVAHGYHIQSAMNFEGIHQATGSMVKNHAFLCVEKTFPFSVAVYILDETALEHARYILKNELRQFKECLESNKWRGYETKIISLPKWAEQIY